MHFLINNTSPHNTFTFVCLSQAQALDVWTPLFPVDPTFSTKYLREKNKVSEIQLCGKRGVNREKGGPDYTCLRKKNKFIEIQLCGKREINREKGGPDVERLWSQAMASIFKVIYGSFSKNVSF